MNSWLVGCVIELLGIIGALTRRRDARRRRVASNRRLGPMQFKITPYWGAFSFICTF